MMKMRKVILSVLMAVFPFVLVSCNAAQASCLRVPGESWVAAGEDTSAPVYFAGTDKGLYTLDEQTVSLCREDFSGYLLRQEEDTLYFLDGDAFCSLSLDSGERESLYQIDGWYRFPWFDGRFLRWLGEEGLYSVEVGSGEGLLCPIDEPILVNELFLYGNDLYYNEYGSKALVRLDILTGEKRTVTEQPEGIYGFYEGQLFCGTDGICKKLHPENGKTTELIDCGETGRKCISADGDTAFFYAGRQEGQHFDSRNYYAYQDGEWHYLCNVPSQDSLAAPHYFQSGDTLYFRSLYLPEGEYMDISPESESKEADSDGWMYTYALKADGTLYLLSKEQLPGPLA